MAMMVLYTLRIELRVHCFYYLDLAYREGIYSLEDGNTEPDSYVTTLVSDLVRFQSCISEWFPYRHYHAILNDLGASLNDMLIASFRYIRSLNQHGCGKLLMNVAALEQFLALIGGGFACGQESPLQKAREYYLLARSGTDNLIAHASTLKTKFTMQQYKAILDVYYRDCTTRSEDDSLMKKYENQLLSLKYLLESGDSTTQIVIEDVSEHNSDL